MSKMYNDMLDIGVILKTTSAASVATAVGAGINGWSIPLFGVPLTVVAMAAAGATISFAYGEPVKSRKKLFTLALANTFIATIAVAVIPKAFGWDWADARLEPPLAGLVAVGARWFVPQFISLVPEVLKKFFKLEKYDKVYNSSSNYNDTDYSSYYEQGESAEYERYEEEEPPRGRKKKA